MWQSQQLGQHIVAFGISVFLAALFYLCLQCWVRWMLHFGPRKLQRLDDTIAHERRELMATRAEMVKHSIDTDAPDVSIRPKESRDRTEWERQGDSARSNKYRLEDHLQTLEEQRSVLEYHLGLADRLFKYWSAEE